MERMEFDLAMKTSQMMKFAAKLDIDDVTGFLEHLHALDNRVFLVSLLLTLEAMSRVFNESQEPSIPYAQYEAIFACDSPEAAAALLTKMQKNQLFELKSHIEAMRKQLKKATAVFKVEINNRDNGALRPCV
mgnify:FL=1